MLGARLRLAGEPPAARPPRVRHGYVREEPRRSRALTELERLLLGRLINADPLERMTRSDDIVEAVRRIIRVLSSPAAERNDDRPFTLVVNPQSNALTDYLLENGLREYLALKPTETFNPLDQSHTSRAMDFMRRDLDGGVLYAMPRQSYYLLVGQNLIIRIGRHEDR